MRLNYIKLAGFKSFVDATKVPFPDQMTCVVGPNGCGKSNVIDAVRWVLGESSAKNLRGDAMTDVIFNGSSSRKPVSRASVELMFDNSSGRLQGEYAAYQEISVKRLVTRDGQSAYFLNGSKCRRRDITDLFLGTGLGPRSYAIIEQGMISRLIESRPQELRVFIEEAAGISRYKERRKETESRMRRTHENLLRLTDVRDELGIQLEKLQRQAAAATRYKKLKSDERILKAQLQALKWLHYQNQCDRVQAELNQQQTELERWIAEQRGSELGQTELRASQVELKSAFDAAQQVFYQCNNDITRIEQSIQHQRQLAEQRRRDLDDARLQLTQLDDELSGESAEAERLRALSLQLEPELALREAALEDVNEHSIQLEDDFERAQAKVEKARRESQGQQQQIRILQTQLQGADDLIARLMQQYQHAQSQLQAWADKNIEEALVKASATHSSAQADLTAGKESLSKARSIFEDARDLAQQAQQQIRDLQSEAQDLATRRSSYEQLIRSTTPMIPDLLTDWLKDKEKAPLHAVLEVDEGWQTAVQAVAGEWLHAPFVTDASLDDIFSAPKHGGQLLGMGESEFNPDALSSVIKGPARNLAIFRQVLLVDGTDDVKGKLASGQFLLAVNKEGCIFYADGWSAPQNKDESVIAWQESLAQISAQHAANRQAQEVQKKELAAKQEQHQQAQQNVLVAEQEVEDLNHAEIQARATYESLNRQQAEQAEQRERLQDSAEELQASLAEQEERRFSIDEEINSLQQAIATAGPELGSYEVALEDIRRALQQAREQQQQAQQQLHAIQLQKQQSEQALTHLQRNIERAEQRRTQLQERLESLLVPADEDDIELQHEALQEALARREEAEQEKIDLGQKLTQVEDELNTLNQGHHGVQRKIELQREQVEASKLELAAARERGNGLLEGLEETGYALKAVLSDMPEDADEKEWQQRLDKIARSVQQLGAINLAAIEEAEAQAERKNYLDNQHEDLTQSLSLLEDAIKKIDKETRQRFRKTFDQVNSDLSLLFPKVFGGGSAYLALTDEDLLETGVTIMARPPGKKNSTIHLLSGGEKALTALSLVFAIFRLNPAPFCMLDEVDAPLDDANVGRFCRLVQEMSESVQFIYISHNKIAMEMATHLAGVTMQEPGVSRLVAVDVDEAVAMADAS